MANVFDNPSDNVYDAYGKAVGAGQLYNDTLRKNMAFNALAKAYGPEVGDIKLATDANALAQSKAMDPLLRDQQSLQNAGLKQTQDFNTANNPTVLATNKTTADTNANALTQAQAAQKATQVHAALSSAITSLGQQLTGVDDPNQRLALFDAQVEQLAPMLGADPAALKQELAQQRAAVATQGADALPQIQQQLDATLNAGMNQADRTKLQISQAQLDIQKSKAEEQRAKAATLAANGGKTPAQLAKEASQAKAEEASLIEFTDTTNDIAGPAGAIDKAIEYIKAHPDAYGTVAKGILGHGAADIAGTNAYNLAQLLLPITSNVMLDKLAKLKQTSANGSSGLGSLSNAEGETLRASQGSVDQGQSKEQLLASLEGLRAKMKRSQGNLETAYKKAYPTPADATAPAAGTQYTFNPTTGELE